MFVDSHCHINFKGPTACRPFSRTCASTTSRTRCACRSISRRCRRSQRSRTRTTTSMRRSACIPITRTCTSRRSRSRRAGRAPEGRRDRRNGPRLLPSRRPLDRRHGMAARTLSHAYPRRDRDDEAADHPHALVVGGHAADHGRGARGRAGRRDALLHRAVAGGRAGARAELPYLAVGHRHVQECDRRAGRRAARAARPAADRDRLAVPRAGAVSRQAE